MKDRKQIPTNEEIQVAVDVLIAACHGRAFNAGWWHDINSGDLSPKSHGDICSLIHSEVSEAYEGYRKGLMDDKLPEYKMFPVELMDVIIRSFDAIGGLYPEANKALLEKMLFNDVREDHKIESRKKEGGKKL